jgi:hypothetical protein
LSVAGLTTGTTTDEIVVVDASGVMKKVPQTTVGGITTATNGLTKNGTAVELGGPLTKPTTIGTDATNTLTLNGTGLNITSLGSGSVNDSLVVVDPSSGKLKRISPNAVGEKITADNGLTKTGTNVQLGGNLIQPTIITTSATNTIALAGLQSGNVSTDSILVVNATNNVVRRVSPTLAKSKIVMQTTSNNYTITNEDVLIYKGTTAGTITIPDPAANFGREITIINLAQSDNNQNLTLSRSIVIEGSASGDVVANTLPSITNVTIFPSDLTSQSINKITIVSYGVAWFRK